MPWRQKPLSEAECYQRCYGGPRRIEAVRVGAHRPQLLATVSGEEMRRQFEQRLDSREREAA